MLRATTDKTKKERDESGNMQRRIHVIKPFGGGRMPKIEN
jgi:hypothetical protein